MRPPSTAAAHACAMARPFSMSAANRPGLGFGKDVRQNLELLAHIGDLAALGLPVVVGASRKSFLGAVAGVPDPRGRDAISATAAALGAVQGAAVIRIHDVARHRAAIDAAWPGKNAAGS
jgi:dihydropteroate synthase